MALRQIGGCFRFRFPGGMRLVTPTPPCRLWISPLICGQAAVFVVHGGMSTGYFWVGVAGIGVSLMFDEEGPGVISTRFFFFCLNPLGMGASPAAMQGRQGVVSDPVNGRFAALISS